ncbi:MAG: ComF family protein [Alphaproteobacteria bacterium]|nr:ComF family protein [Alphaproteobacteria bacterium]
MLRSMATRAAQQVLDIFYPPSCLACRRPVSQTGVLCAACWSAMPFIERPYCERLGTPFEQDLGPGIISPEAFAHPPVYLRARAVARFEEGPARELVHRLKYGDRLELAGPMGRWMARAGAELLADAQLIIPTPLHRWRLFSRRFNQAAALAQEISRASGVPCDPLALMRVKRTTPQIGLSRAQRADNVQGAFRISEKGRAAIAGKRVVLVDDVLTSRATANAAARILPRGGAAQVDALVFARVV